MKNTLDLRGVVRPVPKNVLDLSRGIPFVLKDALKKVLQWQLENFDLDAPVVKNGRAHL